MSSAWREESRKRIGSWGCSEGVSTGQGHRGQERQVRTESSPVRGLNLAEELGCYPGGSGAHRRA